MWSRCLWAYHVRALATNSLVLQVAIRAFVLVADALAQTMHLRQSLVYNLRIQSEHAEALRTLARHEVHVAHAPLPVCCIVNIMRPIESRVGTIIFLPKVLRETSLSVYAYNLRD